MKNKLYFNQFMFYLFGVLSILSIYLMSKFGYLGGRVYQIGIALFILFVIIATSFFTKVRNLKEAFYLIDSWPDAYSQNFNLKRIHEFYNKYGANALKENDIFNIDDQTAHDLNLDEVLMKISICSSYPGEQMLYHILRTPKNNVKSIRERNKIVEELMSNIKLRSTMQQIFSQLGRDPKSNIFNLFNTNATVNLTKLIIINILSILGLALVISYFFIDASLVPVFFFLFIIYVFISQRTSALLENELSSLQYLGRFVNAIKSLTKIEDEVINEYIDEIRKLYKPISKISTKTKFIAPSNELYIFTETINIFLLTKIRSYYSIISLIKNNRENLVMLYGLMGKLEAYISIASYRTRISNYCIPEFTDESKTLIIENANHPLIDDSIPNSISLKGKGVILTGSNMSGKSTFMRTVALNILLSQSICISHSDKYIGSIFNIMSSLSLKDDVLSGTSYYLEECTSILRILEAIDNSDFPIFCIIDEIFKGTNPIERIAASIEILNYIMDRNAISLIATHDLELAEKCTDKYLRYFFCEDIDKDNGLTFDYKLKKGICNTGNALKLLDYLGYPKEIITNARNNITKI